METTTQKTLPAIALKSRYTDDEYERFLVGLRELDAACGPNKNDSVTALICACIDEGINAGSQIITVLSMVGYNSKHVGATLHHNTGSNHERFQWTRDETGAYCNTGN